MGTMSSRYINMIRHPRFRRRDTGFNVPATPSPDPVIPPPDLGPGEEESLFIDTDALFIDTDTLTISEI